MKRIRWSTQFTRLYKRRIARDEQLTEAFWDSIETFQEDRSLVDDHPLEEKMAGSRSFSINEDYRVVYIEGENEYLFLDIGTHDQVYRR
jgi:addiction module RelE/StbE family toxin